MIQFTLSNFKVKTKLTVGFGGTSKPITPGLGR